MNKPTNQDNPVVNTENVNIHVIKNQYVDVA